MNKLWSELVLFLNLVGSDDFRINYLDSIELHVFSLVYLDCNFIDLCNLRNSEVQNSWLV